MTLRQRITPEQIEALRLRKITTRALAKVLNVTEGHLSRTFPGKIPSPKRTAAQEKLVLRNARNAHRDALALKIIEGTLTVTEAANMAYCCTRTMFRHLAYVRKHGARDA